MVHHTSDKLNHFRQIVHLFIVIALKLAAPISQMSGKFNVIYEMDLIYHTYFLAYHSVRLMKLFQTIRDVCACVFLSLPFIIRLILISRKYILFIFEERTEQKPR